MKEWNIILVTDPNWLFNFCAVILEEQQIMERNKKQEISVKTVNIFNIINYIIHVPNIRTTATLLLRTFLLRPLLFVNIKYQLYSNKATDIILHQLCHSQFRSMTYFIKLMIWINLFQKIMIYYCSDLWQQHASI